ncbi:hypothetical protein KCP76_20380 [Salmonella enterica subsp. enterica serovar Weltevreden]|nr:hypothetical protein KCP76_20380 [Salmonella enterica subsp. enterica serovar Weltevreden]
MEKTDRIPKGIRMNDERNAPVRRIRAPKENPSYHRDRLLALLPRTTRRAWRGVCDEWCRVRKTLSTGCSIRPSQPAARW